MRSLVVLGLTEIAPQWIINDDCPATGKRFDRMANTSRHNRYQPSTGDLRHPVDSHLELALEHLPDFLLRMEMLVDGGAAREIVVRERHILGVEIASLPTRQALNDRKSAGIHDRHRT